MINSSSVVSGLVGLFSREQAESNIRNSQTPALNLIKDMIDYSKKQYDFAKIPTKTENPLTKGPANSSE